MFWINTIKERFIRIYGFDHDVEHAITLGNKKINFEVESKNYLGTLNYSSLPRMSLESILKKIEEPIGLKSNLYEIAKSKIVKKEDKLCFIVSDHTRNTGVDKYLPLVIDKLNKVGITDEQIFIKIANGTHRQPTTDECRKILGINIYERFKERIYTHDAYDGEFLSIGKTSRGNKVLIDYRVAMAKMKVLTGSIVYHYFAGYGGGRKSILPGISSYDTICRNHSMTLHPTENRIRDEVAIGRIKGNPVAEDMQEAANLVGVDYIINTLMNENEEISEVVAGDLNSAFLKGCEIATSIYRAPIKEKADLVIASAENKPNWIQSHKALYNSYCSMKEKGVIILLAPCKEGIGSEKLESWLNLDSIDKIANELRKNPEINGQTAFSTMYRGPSTIVVSELPSDKVKLLRMTPASNVEEALKIAYTRLPDDFSYYLMPKACYTVPMIE